MSRFFNHLDIAASKIVQEISGSVITKLFCYHKSVNCKNELVMVKWHCLCLCYLSLKQVYITLIFIIRNLHQPQQTLHTSLLNIYSFIHICLQFDHNFPTSQLANRDHLYCNQAETQWIGRPKSPGRNHQRPTSPDTNR